MRLHVNRPTVTHEIIDGEAVIVNLVTGNYYSLDKTGADIWSLIEKGVAVSSIAHALALGYEGDPSSIRESVLRLVAQLREEGLVIVDGLEGTAESVSSDRLVAAREPGKAKPPFESPVLQKFTDMQELLVLD